MFTPPRRHHLNPCITLSLPICSWSLCPVRDRQRCCCHCRCCCRSLSAVGAVGRATLKPVFPAQCCVTARTRCIPRRKILISQFSRATMIPAVLPAIVLLKSTATLFFFFIAVKNCMFGAPQLKGSLVQYNIARQGSTGKVESSSASSVRAGHSSPQVSTNSASTVL